MLVRRLLRVYIRLDDTFNARNIIQVRQQCFAHRGAQDKHRVSEIDLSQPRHEISFW